MAATASEEPILTVIARIRRAMPRNPDVMRLCDELEKRLMRVSSAPVNIVNDVDDVNSRKAYMRDYMRKRRAADARKPGKP